MLVIGLMQCNTHKPDTDDNGINVPVLQPHETSSVTVDGATHTAVVQERQNDGTIEKHEMFIPAESTYSVVVSTQTGKATINYKKKGFCLVPTVTATYINQFSAGIGARLFYYNEFGIAGHINYWFLDERVSCSIGLDYRLYKLKLKNVALGISYDTYKTVKAQVNIYL